MKESLYPMIFKRKSFHLFKDTEALTPAEKTTCKRGIMPAHKVAHYNRIDMGIFLLFLELCLEREQMPYERTLYADTGDEEKTLTAVYSFL